MASVLSPGGGVDAGVSTDSCVAGGELRVDAAPILDGVAAVVHVLRVRLLGRQMSDASRRLLGREQPWRRYPFELIEVELKNAVAHGNAIPLAAWIL